jgi:hypothetical protein
MNVNNDISVKQEKYEIKIIYIKDYLLNMSNKKKIFYKLYLYKKKMEIEEKQKKNLHKHNPCK